MKKQSEGKAWDREDALAIVRARKDLPGALMPVLTALQDRFGYIDPSFVSEIADILNLSRTEVHGVISFYHDFRSNPPGRNVVKICRAEACQSMGGRAIEDRACKALGVKFGETSSDGCCTLESVYCLGNCACAPAAMVNGKPYGRVTPEKLDELLASVKGDKGRA